MTPQGPTEPSYAATPVPEQSRAPREAATYLGLLVSIIVLLILTLLAIAGMSVYASIATAAAIMGEIEGNYALSWLTVFQTLFMCILAIVSLVATFKELANALLTSSAILCALVVLNVLEIILMMSLGGSMTISELVVVVIVAISYICLLPALFAGVLGIMYSIQLRKREATGELPSQAISPQPSQAAFVFQMAFHFSAVILLIFLLVGGEMVWGGYTFGASIASMTHTIETNYGVAAWLVLMQVTFTLVVIISAQLFSCAQAAWPLFGCGTLLSGMVCLNLMEVIIMPIIAPHLVVEPLAYFVSIFSGLMLLPTLFAATMTFGHAYHLRANNLSQWQGVPNDTLSLA